MTEFTIHDVASAPEASKPALENIRSAYGMIPNVLGILADSPAALGTYMGIQAALASSAFSKGDQQIIQLTIAVNNCCEYCAAVHTIYAKKMGAEAADVEAIREGRPIAEAKRQALRGFVAQVVDQRGAVDAKDVQAFLDAGWERQHVLEIIAHVALKTLTNYTNHITETPLDDAFAPARWSAKPAAE